MKKPFLTLGLATMLFAVPVGAEHDIRTLAPENSIVVVGVKDATKSLEQFKRTKLWDLWQSEEFQKFVSDEEEQAGDMLDSIFEELDIDLKSEDLMEELDIDKENPPTPTGPMGFALFPVKDNETDTTDMGMVCFADYGKHADKVQEMLDVVISKIEEDSQAEHEIVDMLGYEVHSFDLSQIALAEVMDDDEFGMEDPMNPMTMMPGPADMARGLDHLHVVRDGTTYLMSSDLDALGDALESIKGTTREGLADREDFQAITTQIGSTEAYGVVLMRDLWPMIFSNDDMGMAMMVMPMLNSLVGEIGALGMNMQFDAPTAMVETRFGAYMPKGKAGLTELMDNPAPRASLPGFVGPNAIGVSHMSFRFDGLADLVRTVVGQNPMLQMQVGEQMPMIEAQLQQLGKVLGQDVYSVSTLQRPFTAESLGSSMVVECVDQQGFEDLISQFAPMMGLEPRDFLGQRIYSMPDEAMGMMPGGAFSVGIGGRNIFIGPTPTVQQSLRATSEPGQLSLADEAIYRKAVAALPDEPVVAWGYVNLIDSQEASVEVSRLMTEQMARDWAEQFPEDAEEIEAEMLDPYKDMPQIDYDLIRRYVGPASWQLVSRDDGYLFKMYVVEGGADE